MVSIGGKTNNTPVLPTSALFIFTQQPNGEYYTLLARKCFGPTQYLKSEREQVKHRQYRNPNRYGVGAAGTHKDYWGKWVSIGGGNDKRATSNKEAVEMEFVEECGIEDKWQNSMVKQLNFIDSFPTRHAMVYTAFLPWNFARYLKTGNSFRVKKNLIFASKGEIAELRWIPYQFSDQQRLLQNFDNRLDFPIADYVWKSYITHVEEVINNYISMVPSTSLLKKSSIQKLKL